MIKKKLHKILLLSSITVSAVLLGACRREQPADEQITLVYWGLWEPESAMEDIISEYRQSHPNVTIEYTRRPFSGGVYKEQLLERLASTDPQTSPDIMRIHNTWLPQFVSELAPLPGSIMTEAEYTQAFYDTALRDLKSDGGIYAIPLEIDTLGLYYNKELFENEGLTIAPADWDSFVEYAQKLTKKDENEKITQAGAAIGSSENVLHSAEILSLLMLQSNVTMVNEDKTEATFDMSNNEQGATVVDYYTDFINRHGVWDESLPNSLDMFISGKLGMMLAPSWRVFDILNANPTFEFDTAKAPQIFLGNEVNLSTYWAEAVSKDSENTQAAWEFVKYLSEAEQLKKLYDAQSELRAFGEPYSRKDLRDEIRSAPYVGPFVQMAPTSRNWYMGNDIAAMEALDTMVTEVLGGTSTSKAIESAAEKVTLELQKL